MYRIPRSPGIGAEYRHQIPSNIKPTSQVWVLPVHAPNNDTCCFIFMHSLASSQDEDERECQGMPSMDCRHFPHPANEGGYDCAQESPHRTGKGGGNGSETLKQCLSVNRMAQSYSLLTMAMRTPNGVVLLESCTVPSRIPVG